MLLTLSRGDTETDTDTGWDTDTAKEWGARDDKDEHRAKRDPRGPRKWVAGERRQPPEQAVGFWERTRRFFGLGRAREAQSER
jgi:hypothetical protein